MDKFSPQLVRPLKTAENEFLEILINHFELERSGNGAKLSVEFDENVPAIWNRAGRTHIRSMIPDFEEKVKANRKRLDAFFRGDTERLSISDPEFPFRYASGGALPVIKMGQQEYYCLIYRECFPIGWNLANGGTDARHELLNPLITVERELREELLILDGERRQRYVFEIESDNPEDMPEHVTARRLWGEKLKELGWPPIESFERVLIPIKWLDGPDRMEVQMAGNAPREMKSCFLNINPEDFGIEVDRIAKINIDETVTLCDGEVIEGQLVDSVVGLFEVRRMNQLLTKGDREFLPDYFFYGGIRHRQTEVGELQHIIQEQFVPRMHRTLPKWDRREWDESQYKYDLCPATRGIMEKAARFWAPEPAPLGNYDVFISFAHEDERLARVVQKAIVSQTELSVFFSPELDHSSYGERIDKALSSSNCLIAVATDPGHLGKPWPEYEYRFFHILIRNRKKPANAQVFSYISGFHPADLPAPLPYYHSIVRNEGKPEASIDELLRYVRISVPEKR